MPPELRTVDFWFDPGCPFTWRTSRWLVDVAARRGLDVHWRLMSLGILNADKEVPEQYRASIAAGQGALRVLAAVADQHGTDALGAVYTDLGRRRHEEGADFDASTLRAALIECGLPSALEQDRTATTYDDAIRASHDEGQRRAGTESGTPITALGDGPGAFGPIVVPAPTGDAALALLDALVLLSGVPEFSELKRARAAL